MEVGGHKKILALILLILILTSTTLVFYLSQIAPHNDSDDTDEPIEPEPVETGELVPHDPIIINGPNDFISQNWTGLGTSSNPYLIANLHIISEDFGIFISNPEACFKIVNCIVDNAEHSSIYLYQCYDSFWISECEILGKISIWNSRNGDIDHSNLTDTSWAIHASSSSNCMIQSNKIYGAYAGIYLVGCSEITMKDNTIQDCSKYSILMQHTENCKILSNIFMNKYISMYGTNAETWHHEFSNNTFNGKLIGYFWGVQDEILEVDEFGSLILANCSNVAVENANISNTFNGIQMGFCTSCCISESCFENDDVGVLMNRVTNCTVKNCILESCETGVSIDSYNCTIQSNFFNHTNIGIYCFSCQNAIISDNTVINSSDTGIKLSNTMNLLVKNNTISDSENSGILLDYSRDDVLQENVLVNNGIVISDYDIWSWKHQIVNNTANGRPIGYFYNLNTTSIEVSSFGQIIVVNCTNLFLNNGTFFNASVGIQAAYCSNFTCRNVAADGNSKYGIYSIKSDNLILQLSTFNKNRYGACITDCPSAKSINNTFNEDTEYGLYLHSSKSAIVVNNTAIDCRRGLYAGASEYTKFVNCVTISCNVGIGAGSSSFIEVNNSTMSKCGDACISLWASGSSIIQDNDIIGGHTGISIIYSTNVSILSNVFTGSSIWITESYEYYYNIVEWWKHNIVNNTVNGKPVLYLWNETGLSVSAAGYGQIIITNCTDIVVNDGDFSGITSGVLVGRCMNCTITNCRLASNKGAGIYIETSNRISMINITSSGNQDGGIRLVYSEECSVFQSTFVSDGIAIDGNWLNHWNHSLESNTVNGKSIAYFFQVINGNYNALDCGQLIVVGCENSEFSTLDSSSILYLNNITRGIQVAFSTNCTFSSFNVVNCTEFGVILHRCTNIKLVNNNLNNNTGTGLRISLSTFCLIKSNTICYNRNYGIDIWYYTYYGESYGNQIYNNDIGWNLIANARDIYGSNMWDDGSSLGNRWSDYSGSGYYIIYAEYAVDRFPSLLI